MAMADRQIRKSPVARQLTAVLVCMLFMADWASHIVLPDGPTEINSSISAMGEEHDHEHGGYFCRGEDHREKTMPGVGQDVPAHSGCLAPVVADHPARFSDRVGPFSFSAARVISRRGSPPFVPPEIS
jgi:hypothetical protein